MRMFRKISTLTLLAPIGFVYCKHVNNLVVTSEVCTLNKKIFSQK